jgi:hypothetical protein
VRLRHAGLVSACTIMINIILTQVNGSYRSNCNTLFVRSADALFCRAELDLFKHHMSKKCIAIWT